MLYHNGKPQDPGTNIIFRPKDVMLSIVTLSNNKESENLTGQDTGGTLPSVILTDVQSIQLQLEGGSGVTRGAVAPIVQMWYMGPYVINIQGKSYTGLFQDEKYDRHLIDNDIDRLMQFDTMIRKQFNGTDTPQNMFARLRYGSKIPRDGMQRSDRQIYDGAIDNIKFGEDETMARYMTYTIKFTGTRNEGANVTWGTNGQQTDMSIIGQALGAVSSLKSFLSIK